MRDKFILAYDAKGDKPKLEPRDPQFENDRRDRVLQLASTYKLQDCNFKDSCTKLPKDSLISPDALADLFSFSEKKTFKTKEFASVYLNRRNQIQDELQALKHEQNALKSHLQFADLQKKRKSAHQDGKLIVQIQKLEGLPQNDDIYRKFRVHLECKNQTIETRAARFLEDSIMFNEMFSFNIPAPTSDTTSATLEVILKEDKTMATIASNIVQVQNLKDQRVKQIQLELNGTSFTCKATVAVQWIHDPPMIYSAYAGDYTKRQQAIGPQIRDKDSLLKQYDRPFNNSRQPMGHIVKGVVRGDLAADKFDEMLENYGLTNTQKASQVFVSIYLILVCFASYARAMFLDQGIVLFAFFFNLEPRRWSEKKYRNCIGCLFMAMILDIWWISCYLLQWGGKAADVPFVHITRIFTVITFVWRIILMLFFWKCSRDMKTRTAKGIKKNRFPNSPSKTEQLI